MAISRYTTFLDGQVLTHTDLNGLQDHIIDNGESVAWPATTSKDLDGQSLILDADGDTSITASTDDRIDVEILGFDHIRITKNHVLHRTNSAGLPVVSSDDMAQNVTGLELCAHTMDTTNLYTPSVKFGSTDPSFTTDNPKYGAAICGRATETYAADTDGGMALDFFTVGNAPGTNPSLLARMSINQDGNVGVGVTTPLSKLHVMTSSSGATPNASADDFTVESSGTTGISILGGASDPVSLYMGSSASNSVCRFTVDTATNKVELGCFVGTGDVEIKYGAGSSGLFLDGTTGNLGIGTASPGSKVHVDLATQDLEIVDAGTVGASDDGWIEVELAGVQHFIRVHLTK